MANSLLITKETGGYFSFVLNGNTAKKIQSIGNDLLIDSTQCHFKTKNGANIIKEQFIYPADVTLVSGGTFTFTTTAQLWNKLIEVGYFSSTDNISKLDKGGYEGTAQDLKNDINSLGGGKSPYNVFKFIQKGFSNTDLTTNEVGDIFSGWKNDGTIRYSEAKYLGGALNDSDNFLPLVQTEI